MQGENLGIPFIHEHIMLSDFVSTSDLISTTTGYVYKPIFITLSVGLLKPRSLISPL